MDAQKQLRTEIHAAIKRLGMESDLTFYQALGVLRVVEHDVIEQLTKATGGEDV